MTRIQPFPAPCAEKARAALPRPAGTAVFVLTHEARSALCGRFGLEDSQLDRALGLLGAARVEDPDVPHGPIEADAAELLARLAEGRLPGCRHACAGVETARFSLLGRDVRVARVRGAAQMERLLGSFGPHALPWQVIEVLVCAGGCDRG